MRNRKLVETLCLAVFVFLALEFFIFPGLESDSLLLNAVALTSFFLLVVLVFFGGIFSGFRDNFED